MTIDPLPIGFNLYQYRCILSTVDGSATSTAGTLTVLQSPVPTLAGLAAVCPYSLNTYTTEAGMTGYAWAVSAGGTITAGGTALDNTATISWNVAGPQTVSVNYAAPNTCTAATPTIFNVTVFPLVLPTITGPTSVCQRSKFNVYTTEACKTAYTWVVSAGGNIQAGGTAIDNTVTVKWNTVGAQSVSVNYTSADGCIAPVPTVTNITVNPLPVPTIAGPTTVNVGSTGTYTTESGMTNYSWTVTGSGCTITGGQGTSAVTISFSSIGNKTIRLTYTNANGCSPLNPTALMVKVVKPKDLAAGGSVPGDVNNDLIPTFEVYPSPNQGQFTAAINSPVEDMYSIWVYNSVGVRLYEIQNVKVSGSNETMIDISPAPPGLYIVVFMNNQTQTVRKFFVGR